MSLLTYGAFALQLVRTNSVRRVPNWSDDGTEYKWTDFVIDVTCIYNPQATSYNAMAMQQYGNLPEITDSGIRHYLLQPRLPLLYQESGLTILHIPSNLPGGGAIDADNGPIPIGVHIVKITPATFHINYSIKCSIIECILQEQLTDNPIVSSRYSRTETINDEYLSTIVTSGTTYFRSDVLADIGGNADEFRKYIIPPRLFSYKRELKFGIAANGTMAEWTTTDVQQKVDIGDITQPGTPAGSGITSMGLTYITSMISMGSMGPAGPGSIARVNCWAVGMRGVNSLAILLACQKVVDDKIASVFGSGVNSGGDVIEDVFNNRIELNMSYYIRPNPAGSGQEYQMFLKPIGIPLVSLGQSTAGLAGSPIIQSGINPAPPADSNTRVSPGYELAVSEFAEACFNDLNNINVDDTGNNPPQNPPGPPIGNNQPVTGYYIPPQPVPNPSDIPYCQQTDGNTQPKIGDKGIYSRAEIASTYTTNSGVATAPFATALDAPEGTSINSPPTCVNLQLFQPITHKIVEWFMESIGFVPEIPNPAVPSNLSNNYVLVRREVKPIGIELMPDQYTRVYRASGVNHYSVQFPMKDDATIQFDIPPWVGVSLDQYTQIVFGNFSNNSINLEGGLAIGSP